MSSRAAGTAGVPDPKGDAAFGAHRFHDGHVVEALEPGLHGLDEVVFAGNTHGNEEGMPAVAAQEEPEEFSGLAAGSPETMVTESSCPHAMARSGAPGTLSVIKSASWSTCMPCGSVSRPPLRLRFVEYPAQPIEQRCILAWHFRAGLPSPTTSRYGVLVRQGNESTQCI